MAKTYKLSADQVVQLIPELGGCLASDRITVDGAPVGSMSRDVPRDELDSGWCFLAGDEEQDYLDDPEHLAIYSVNTIANLDPTIIPFLYALPGQVYDRDPVSGGFVEAPDSEPDPSEAALPEGIDVVQGTVAVAPELSLELPTPFRRRYEDGCLVLWRCGLTFWIAPTPRPVDPPAAAEDVRIETSDHGRQVSYRVREGGAVPSLNLSLSRPNGCLQISAYTDREAEVQEAYRILGSLSI